MLHIQTRNVRSPVRHFHIVVDFQRAQPELPHPCGVILLPGQALDDLCRKTCVKTVVVRAIVSDVIDTAIDVRDLGLLDGFGIVLRFVLICIVYLFAHIVLFLESSKSFPADLLD